MPPGLPSVSIVTPSYNQGPFIEATIRSVLEQQYAGLEYWVMDGGSTDATPDILHRYADRIHYVSEKDEGQSDAINKGFDRCHGQILGWLNSDDTYAPGAVAAVAAYFRDHPEVALVYGNADYIDAAGHPIVGCAHIEPYDAHRLLHYSDFIVQPAAFFRREAFEAVGGVDKSLNYCMDYDLWLKIAGRYQVAYLPQVLAHFRWFGENKTAVGGRQRLAEIEAMARRHGARGLPAYVRLEAVRLHLAEAVQAGRQGQLGAAAASLVRSAGQLLQSPRAGLSLLSPRTWKIIYTGQRLRNHARTLQRRPQSILHPSAPPPAPSASHSTYPMAK
jgi:hypothetical protein